MFTVLGTWEVIGQVQEERYIYICIYVYIDIDIDICMYTAINIHSSGWGGGGGGGSEKQLAGEREEETEEEEGEEVEGGGLFKQRKMAEGTFAPPSQEVSSTPTLSSRVCPSFLILRISQVLLDPS